MIQNNLSQPLVSIITPCYNGEKFVYRFLDSVLGQAYNNIELIFINDGSTDKTEEIVLSYRLKFVKKNIRLEYVYQENKGVANALNRGLKMFKGDYLTWPDSDDILHKDNIKNKVAFLEERVECSTVLCKSRVLREIDFRQIGVLVRTAPKKEDNLFYDLIVQNNAYLAPGGYMVRTQSFLDVIPNRHIYESPLGQNWQILLPIIYKYKYGYLDEFLYDYVVRSNSVSRKAKSKEDFLIKIKDCESILKTVIERIDMSVGDRNYYLSVVDKKYAQKRLKIAAYFKDVKLLKKQYIVLEKKKWLSWRNRFVYFRGNHQVINSLYKKFVRFKGAISMRLKLLFYDLRLIVKK